MSKGYFRFPTVSGDKVAFTSEDDLWEVPLTGGVARRLTAGRGTFSRPCYSPGGKWLAFSSAEEGHLEIFVMPAQGGEIKRLTYLGAQSAVAGWQDERTVLFASNAFESQRVPTTCRITIDGGMPESLRLGPAMNLALGPKGGVVLERNSFRSDPAHWKRYRGGTAGKLWYADSLDGDFRPLIQLKGNLARPMWIGDRVYFVSDHEGIANLYSCTKDGGALARETDHKDFYVRNPSGDGKTIVYHAGAKLYSFDPAAKARKEIPVEYLSQRTQRQRRFVSSAKNFESGALCPKGELAALTVRGQYHFMRLWDGPVGTRRETGTRFRLAQFLSDGERIAAVTDKANGEECLEIYNTTDYSHLQMENAGWGRFTELVPAPKGDLVAFANHRSELWIADTAKKSSRQIARNRHKAVSQFAFSPDGRWLAFAETLAWNRSRICVADTVTGEVKPVTVPLLEDFCPSFDPDGKYLYFLSQREFNPVYDGLQFELSFPKGVVACVLTLQKATVSPFLETSGDEGEKDKKDKEVEVKIDFDGIEKRVLSFPLPEGKYSKIAGLKGRVMLLNHPVEGAVGHEWLNKVPPAKAEISVYDFKNQKAEPFMKGVSDFTLSHDTSKAMVRVGQKLRVVKTGEKPDETAAKEPASRKSGWIDFDRVKTLIEPAGEWKQMIHEVWRLQRDHFWREDMSKINWARVLKRYLPLVDHINTRSEFGDLVWELQGELGTSHAYDMGGDYRREPSYPVGMLGADFAYDDKHDGYRIEKIMRGDSWKASEAGPLSAPGVLLEKGDVLLAVNGVRLSKAVTPYQLLMHQAGSEVRLTAVTKAGETRQLRVRTLEMETPARYREWTESNREYVTKATRGRVGYIHVPDMGPRGFAEFHRHFLRDFDCDALIVDVRYNGGGHVSSLLLEKLLRKRFGVDQSRWFGTFPFPGESPAGPMVALTNEYAGSDGDIFSHSFKLKKAGPLIGKRTWGGVIGISPTHRLVDGGITTQPEYSFWFADVGFQVENYGTDPDIDVDIAPHNYRRGEDPQLDRAILEVTKLLEKMPPFRPSITEYPNLGFEI
jgi:tricorn protease